MLTLAFIYYKYRGLSTVQGVLNGLRPAVLALIGSAGLALVELSFWKGNEISLNFQNIDAFAVIIFAFALAILRKWKVNPIFIMIGAGIVGICVYPMVL